MQVSTTTSASTHLVPSGGRVAAAGTDAAAATPAAPRVLGRATMLVDEGFGPSAGRVPRSVDILAGETIAAGVTDIATTAQRLVAQHFTLGDHTSGLVAFVRNGDAWDAVRLLAPTVRGLPPMGIWGPWNIADLRVADGVRIDAIWQVSGYGFDTRWGTPGSTIRAVP